MPEASSQTPEVIGAPIPLMEQLADKEHHVWSCWTTYMLPRIKEELLAGLKSVPMIHAAVNAAFDDLPSVKRWNRQRATGYEDLSEGEKESDRREVRGRWPLYAASVREARLPGDGGDVVFIPAKDPKDRDVQFSVGKASADGKDGSLIFMDGDGGETLRFDPDGVVYLHGSVLATQSRPVIWSAFKAWMASATGRQGVADPKDRQGLADPKDRKRSAAKCYDDRCTEIMPAGHENPYCSQGCFEQNR